MSLPDPTPTDLERFIVLIACEKLKIEEAEEWVIEPDPTMFKYSVEIKGQPAVSVYDEEIVRRRPLHRRR